MFSKDEDRGVDDDSDMDDGDDDDNESGGKGMEGNEQINDDERRDDEAVKPSKTKTMQAFSIGMKLMLKLSKKIEIVQKEWQFLKERSPIVRTHQLHVTINLAKTLKTMGISILVKIIMLLST